jgi:hypothetical protein
LSLLSLTKGPDGWIYEKLAQLTPEEKRKAATAAASSKAAAQKRTIQVEAAKKALEKPDPSQPLQLLDYGGEYNEFATTIVGRVRNNTRRKYSYAQIVFNLYDSAGNQVGSAMANVNNLEPEGIWKFKAVGLVPAKTFKVSGLTGF